MPEMQRKTPTQSRARATVDAIVMAAAHIVKTEGAERATTNRIARMAGVSIGSLYQYFPNKEAILETVREQHGEWFEQGLRSGIEEGARLPLREGVTASIRQLVAMHRADRGLHTEMSGRHPLSRDEIETYRERTRSYLREHGDEIRPLDPDLAAVIVTRASEALVHGTAIEEPEWLDHPQFAEEVTELLVRYLAG